MEFTEFPTLPGSHDRRAVMATMAWSAPVAATVLTPSSASASGGVFTLTPPATQTLYVGVDHTVDFDVTYTGNPADTMVSFTSSDSSVLAPTTASMLLSTSMTKLSVPVKVNGFSFTDPTLTASVAAPHQGTAVSYRIDYLYTYAEFNQRGYAMKISKGINNQTGATDSGSVGRLLTNDYYSYGFVFYASRTPNSSGALNGVTATLGGSASSLLLAGSYTRSGVPNIQINYSKNQFPSGNYVVTVTIGRNTHSLTIPVNPTRDAEDAPDPAQEPDPVPVDTTFPGSGTSDAEISEDLGQ